MAGVAVAALAVIGIVIIYIGADFFSVLALSAGLWLLAVVAARAALRGTEPQMREYETPPPRQPFIIMNPRSGGGKVDEFGLAEKARGAGCPGRALGAGPRQVDVAKLARGAVASGADLLGVAGGDGTQALVAGVAAEHDVPLLVIPAGTRNHFALDLGLDRDDLSGCLNALTDGTELRIDLGMNGGRPFVNNASFGAYAELVQSPEYRDDKTQTPCASCPTCCCGNSGARLRAGPATFGSRRHRRFWSATTRTRRRTQPGSVAAQAGSRHAGGDRRTGGQRSTGGRPAPGRRRRGVTVASALEVTVTADADEIPVGVDGEALIMRTPVRCVVRPRALRVRVPRTRPGRREKLDWQRVRTLAGGLLRRAGRASSGAESGGAAVDV